MLPCVNAEELRRQTPAYPPYISEIVGVTREIMKFLYFLDCYSDGGAELGFATLVENGFFANHQLSICAMTGERLKASTIPLHVESFFKNGKLNTWTVITSIFPLIRFIWQWQPDIMIISLARANLIGRLASLFFPSMKVVTFEHNTNYRNKLAPLLRYTSYLVDGVLVDHHETWEAVRGLFYPYLAPELSFYVPLVMFPSITEAIPDNSHAGKARTPIRIITAGRLTCQKNYVELLYAIRSLLKDGYNVKLFIAGKGRTDGRASGYFHSVRAARSRVIAWLFKGLDFSMF